jgi:hypothetical protein
MEGWREGRLARTIAPVDADPVELGERQGVGGSRLVADAAEGLGEGRVGGREGGREG